MTSAARKQPTGRTSQRGASLIEVLIAFLILSVGITGVLMLQSVAKTAQHQAMQRSTAVGLAQEMLEMIRANPRGTVAYHTGASALGGGSITLMPSPNCDVTTCDAAQLAAFDLWHWEQALDGAAVTAADGGGTSAGLLQPRGCVLFTPDTLSGKLRTGQVDVFIQWRGLQETTDAVQGGFVCGADPADEDLGFRRQVVVSSFVLDEEEL